MDSISDRVVRYQRSRKASPSLFRDILLFIYQYLPKCHLPEDDRGAFILYFYQQIHRLIEMYQDVGSSFEAYLATHIKYQIRSFRQQQISDGQQLRFIYDEYRQRPAHTMSFQDSYYQYEQKDRSLEILKEMFLYIQKNKTVTFQDTFRRRVWLFAIKHIKTFTVEQMESAAGIFSLI